ncbi:hypothetical protein O3M35_004386 [Rhynocoris fuscipes]|uniref:Uncharacterized protein n=1 Tax=Rhynocoris fuscipes TaxID=488301 RepID=A0AAW1CLM4_9HEMI
MLLIQKFSYHLKEYTYYQLRIDSKESYSLKVEGHLSDSNKLMFSYGQNLKVNLKEAIILIETNRAIYKANQKVYFRILILRKDLLPYNDAIDIYLMDADDFIIRRWLSMYANNGIISLKYILPKYLKEGFWKIKVVLNNQIEEKKFKVENFYDPLFDVYVNTAMYHNVDNNEFKATISGMKTTEEIIRANASLFLSVKNPQDYKFNILHALTTTISEKNWEIKFAIEGKVGQEYKLEAGLTDLLTGETEYGFSITKIVPNKITLRYLHNNGVFLFQPNFPFITQISVEYSDGRNVPEDLLMNSEIRINLSYQSDHNQSWNENFHEAKIFPTNWPDDYIINIDENFDDFKNFGVLNLLIRPPKEIKAMKVTASILIDSKKIASAELFCLRKNRIPSEGLNLKVSSSSYTPILGDFAVFHIHSGFKISKLYYLTTSNGNCQTAGTLEVKNDGVSTAALPISRDISLPLMTFIVFGITSDGYLVSDSVHLPLSTLETYQMELTLNLGKDFKGDRVEVIINGDEGAYIAVSSTRSNAYPVHQLNIITIDKIHQALFQEFRWINKITRKQSDDNCRIIQYFQTPNYGANTFGTLNLAALFYKTNLISSTNSDWCSEEEDLYPCFTDDHCYSAHERCDGIAHCSDAVDEMNCFIENENDNEFNYRRISRTTLLYDSDDGDWGYFEIKKNDHEGDEYELISAPIMADLWYFNAFSVSTKHGLSIIHKPVMYSTERRWSAILSGPKHCHRGEQVGLILIMCNHDTSAAYVLVSLKSSNQYKYVQVGKDGIISSYNATLTSKEIHLFLYIGAEKQERVDIPIVPQIEKGAVTVKIVASTQAGYAISTHTIHVLGEGSEVRKHTSKLIDLRSRAYQQLYFGIPIEETPIVPYEEWRRYVFGSPEATISITGSLLGPYFPEGISSKQILERDLSKGTDSLLLEFAANIWTLHYRRYTTRDSEYRNMKAIFDLCNRIYAIIISRMANDGGFSYWSNTKSSVWLTAWVLRALSPAIYADWEDYIYIEANVLEKASIYLVTHQLNDGSFTENLKQSSVSAKNVSPILVTCEVIMGLTEVAGILSAAMRNMITIAISKAVSYLKSSVVLKPNLLEDSKLVTAMAYSLYKSNGIVPEKLLKAFYHLKRTDQDGFTYWSDMNIESVPIRVHHNYPIIMPRNFTHGLSDAIYSTSYGLLLSISMAPFSSTNELIVSWLSTVKFFLNGFLSVTDTIVGYQALTEYANRVRLLDLTTMNISLSSSIDENFQKQLILNKNHSKYFFEINRPHGIIELKSRGRGLSIIHMTSSYRVDRKYLTDQSEYNKFYLKIFEYYSNFRNKSSITVEVCTKWLEDESFSGPTTLEIDNPTGYFTTETRIIHEMKKAKHLTLCDTAVSSKIIAFYFTHIDTNLNCFNYTLRRQYAVANMTQYRKAIIYENNRRENFAEVIIESTALYLLSVCEVCASYQCPYCPHYNASKCNNFNIILYFITFIIYISFYN